MRPSCRVGGTSREVAAAKAEANAATTPDCRAAAALAAAATAGDGTGCAQDAPPMNKLLDEAVLAGALSRPLATRNGNVW